MVMETKRQIHPILSYLELIISLHTTLYLDRRSDNRRLALAVTWASPSSVVDKASR